MNLSRAAKKFRDQMEPEGPKRAKAKKKAAAQPAPAPAPPPVVQAPAPAPVPTPEPAPPVVADEPAPQPKKSWPVKSKRPRFVREKAEKREPVTVPPLQLGSSRPAAKLLTKNLALPPKDEAPKPGRI